jgi:hypothetical protein
MSVLIYFCSAAVILIFAPLGFGSMVSAIARTRGRDTKRLLSIAGFLHLLLTFILGVAWLVNQWYRPELSNMILMLVFLVIGFGIIIAPLIELAVRMQNPDLFKKSVATTAAQPSNVPMTPEPETPDQETRSVS